MVYGEVPENWLLSRENRLNKYLEPFGLWAGVFKIPREERTGLLKDVPPYILKITTIENLDFGSPRAVENFSPPLSSECMYNYMGALIDAFYIAEYPQMFKNDLLRKYYTEWPESSRKLKWTRGPED